MNNPKAADCSSRESALPSNRKLSYGWVVVIVCTTTIAITYGIMYSYSVFFKPIVAYFNWDRATVSSVYSVSLVLRGVAAIGVGWLADRYGAIRITFLCGFMCGLGLILASRVTELWQLYVAYGLIEAIGLSGSFTIGIAMTTRWFARNRGLALGIVSSGVGLGTFILVPAADSLISASDWSTAFVIFGIAAWLVISATAFLLKSPPSGRPPRSDPAIEPRNAETGAVSAQPGITFSAAIHSKILILMVGVFIFTAFCVQLIMVHLVNYATDIGISSLQAATFISIIGIFGIAGRLLMGSGSDKIGVNNTVIICCALITASLICLVFTKSVWTFYLFAVLFGFAYGGEVPQIPMLVGHFFGTRSMAALLGLILCLSNIGGALGPWVGGKVFDMTQNYQFGFIIAATGGALSLIMAFVLKKYAR